MNRKLKLTELKRASVEEYKTQQKLPVIIVLDNIRSLNNIGSFFRTVDAFAMEKIYLCGITATPPHRDIQKTALGATESVDWEYFESTTLLIEQLKKEGYTIYSIEQTENSISLESFKPNNEKIVVIFGNEVNGVEQSVIDHSDECIEIPQFGTKHSLNVSVSGGIILWQLSFLLRGNN